jgi:hypothetical protein
MQIASEEIDLTDRT